MSDVAQAEAEATSNTEAKAETTATPAAKAGTATKAAPEAPSQDSAKAAAQPAEKVEGKAEPAAPAVPAELVFKDPEGKPITGKVIETFAAMAKEQGWTQDVANEQLGRLSQSLRDSRTAMEAAWDAELQADKEIGGDKLPEHRNLAKQAAERIGGPDYLKWLDESGMGKNPQTVRFLAKVGKAISPDKFTAGVPVVGRPGDIANPNDTSGAAFAKFYPATEPTNR